jgi:hypothetical protein
VDIGTVDEPAVVAITIACVDEEAAVAIGIAERESAL